MICPREVKEMPCWDLVLIMIDSRIGRFTGRSDCQATLKKAPDPPALSDSATQETGNGF